MRHLFICFFITYNLSVAISQQIVRGPYVQLGTPQSMTIRWRTDVPVVGKVQYGTSLTDLSLQVSENIPTMEHEIGIGGLTPATVYYYNVGTTEVVLQAASSDQYFKTSPIHGKRNPYRFWIIGDFGNGSQQQKDVRNAFTYFNGTQHTDAWIWLGDNAYNDGTDLEYQTRVFEVYPNEFKKMVAWPCPGNHDYGSVSLNNTGPYFDNFTLPTNAEAGGLASGTEGYYSFNYGNVHFVSLNTEYLIWVVNNESEMANWLRNDLSNHQMDFVVVYFHQPPYSKGSHDSDDSFSRMEMMRSNFNPIFEEFGVDLVLTGHSHGYERSYLIKGHYGKSSTFNASTMIVDEESPFIKYTNGSSANKGTVYATVGCSGKLSSSGDMNHPANAISTNAYPGSMILEVDSLTLTAKFLTAYDGVKDEFVIRKVTDSDTVSSVGDVSNNATFSIAPNPNQGTFEVHCHHSFESATIELVNLEGKTVEKFQLGNTKKGDAKQFSTKHLPKGVYLARLKDKKATYSRRIIIE